MNCLYDNFNDTTISLAANIGVIIAELEECRKYFSEGNKEKAVEVLRNVENKIDRWLDQIEELDLEGEDSNRILVKKLKKAKMNISWVNEKERKN